MIKLIVYQTGMGKEPWKDFLSSIKDAKAKVAISKAIINMERGLPGNIKSLGGGLKERKVDVGKGYRIYFYNDGQEMVVLLGGSHKGDQDKEIAKARDCLADYKRQKSEVRRTRT